MAVLQPYLDLLADHLFLVVFLASLIDATGLPFPGRLSLVVAGMLAVDGRGLAGLVLLGGLGAVVGDHVLYLVGVLGGTRLLALYCRLTFSSPRCVETSATYFRRLGPPAILLGRFSTSVRLFAAVMAGSGHLGYRRFLLYDVVGALLYTALWVSIGHLFGEEARTALAERGGVQVLLILAPLGVVAVLVFRLWRRTRPDTRVARGAGGTPSPR